VELASEAEQFGPFSVTSYQLILGGCAFINMPVLLAVIMALPTRTSGCLHLLFIVGLPIVIFAYRYFPLAGAVYGMMPLFHSILGRWIHFPLFFTGIGASIPLVKWIFAATAIAGCLWHWADRRSLAKQAKDDSGSDIASRQSSSDPRT
jgi:hypothetical protein